MLTLNLRPLKEWVNVMKKYFLVRQEDRMDCGIASLSAIFKFYGKTYSLVELKKFMNYDNRKGTTFCQLYDTAIFLNFFAEAHYVDSIMDITKEMLQIGRAHV